MLFVRGVVRACGGLLLLGLFCVSLGCGPNYKARATVKGKVTFAGKNLTVGQVVFHGKHNLTGAASIDKNGNYVMTDAPIGEVKITVEVPKMPPGGLGRMKSGAAAKAAGGKSVNPENPNQSIPIMGEMPSHIMPIPEKYNNPETSGLTYKVEKGEHTHDITLTP